MYVPERRHKMSTNSNIISVAKKIIKSNKDRENINGEIKVTDKVTGQPRWFFTDAHYVMEVAESTGLKAPNVNTLGDGGNSPSVLIDAVKTALMGVANGTICELPESFLDEVKTKRKEVYKYQKLIYAFENGYSVNAEYLAMAVKATGSNKVWIPQNPNAFCVIRGEKASFYILPIHCVNLKVGFNVKDA